MTETGERPAPPADTNLLERGPELASLALLLEQASAGEGRLALIEGLAGIGKSRLLAEARTAAGEAGMRVLGARGSELGAGFALGAVRQLFEPLLLDDRDGNLLAGPAQAAE